MSHLTPDTYHLLSNCLANHREDDKRRFNVLLGVLLDGLYDRINVELELSSQGSLPSADDISNTLNERRTPLAKKVFEIFDSLPVDANARGLAILPSGSAVNHHQAPQLAVGNPVVSPPTATGATGPRAAVSVAVNNASGQAVVIRRPTSQSVPPHPAIKTEIVDGFQEVVTNHRVVNRPGNQRPLSSGRPQQAPGNARNPNVQRMTQQPPPQVRGVHPNRSQPRPPLATTRAAYQLQQQQQLAKQQMANQRLARVQKPPQMNTGTSSPQAQSNFAQPQQNLGRQMPVRQASSAQQMAHNNNRQSLPPTHHQQQQLIAQSASTPRTYLRQNSQPQPAAPTPQQGRQQNIRQFNLPMPVNIKQEIDDEASMKVVPNQKPLFPPVWSSAPPMLPKSQEERNIIEAQVAYYKQNVMKGQANRSKATPSPRVVSPIRVSVNSSAAPTSTGNMNGAQMQPTVAVVPMSPGATTSQAGTSQTTAPSTEQPQPTSSVSGDAIPSLFPTVPAQTQPSPALENDNSVQAPSRRSIRNIAIKRSFEDFAEESEYLLKNAKLQKGTPARHLKYSHKNILVVGVKCRNKDCDMMLSDRKQMIKHCDQVHQMNPHFCPVPGCDQSFSHHGYYGPHIRDHGKVKWTCRYGCSPDVIYDNATQVNEHLQFAHEEGDYRCNLCGFAAPFQIAVMEHVRAAHN